jgi:hypothetical protein
MAPAMNWLREVIGCGFIRTTAPPSAAARVQDCWRADDQLIIVNEQNRAIANMIGRGGHWGRETEAYAKLA